MSKSDDLISRQDALNALGEEPLVWNEHNDEWELGKNKQWHEDRQAIMNVVSFAQAAIIFCKDCYYYHTHDHRCKRWNHGARVTDFCSRAEAKRAQDE